MLVALIALFVAIGGISWAATKIGTSDIKNSAVTAKKLHKNAVTTKKIKNNAVNGAKVKDNSLTGNDLDESTLSAPINVDHATTADNALKLGGLDPFEYERATTVLDGQGAINSTNPQAIFNSLNANFTLTTDGDSDNNTQLLLQNKNSSGNLIGTPFTKAGPGPAFGVPAGMSQQIGPASGGGTDFLDTLITDAGSPSKSVWLHCLFNFSAGTPTAFCWGIQT